MITSHWNMTANRQPPKVPKISVERAGNFLSARYSRSSSGPSINGFIKNGQLGLTSLYNIKNLDFLFKIKKDEYFLKKLKTNFNKIKISSTQIKIKKKKKFIFN